MSIVDGLDGAHHRVVAHDDLGKARAGCGSAAQRHRVG